MGSDVDTHDLVIVGAGPAALSAAIYTSREDIETLILEKGVIGGMAAITDQVDNYPGFAEGVSGLDLATALQSQAERFGAKIDFAEVTSLTKANDKLVIIGTSNGEIKARAVLIATGTDWKKLGIPGEDKFFGRGVHVCATCDGAFYRDKRLVVIGGGNSAVQESIFLTRFASHIDLLVRSEIKASEVLRHELEKHKDKISVHLGVSPKEIAGEDKVSYVLCDAPSGETKFECDGVFVFIGLKPTTGFLRDTSIEIDEYGFIKTNEDLMTALPGVFAAGDVRSGATMQIASATGEGATAALKIREYLKHA